MTRPAIGQADALAANAMLIAVRQAADVICDRWSLSVILAAFLGVRRFNEFVEETGATGGLLTARLRRLEADGIFLKVPYSRRPMRHEYRLTNMGWEFFEVIVEMVRWEQMWSADPSNPIFQLIQARSPGRLLEPLLCKSCGRPVSARDVGMKVSRALLQKMPVKQSAYRRSIINRHSDSTKPPLLHASLDMLGDKWSIEIINCAFLGIRRFGDFKSQTGIAANILTDRLNRLEAAGFLSRGDNRNTPKPARGYWLTQQGISFYPVLLRMQDWADAWITDRYRSPVTLIHRPCGQILHAERRTGT